MNEMNKSVVVRQRKQDDYNIFASCIPLSCLIFLDMIFDSLLTLAKGICKRSL